jgi:hypothetical protein
MFHVKQMLLQPSAFALLVWLRLSLARLRKFFPSLFQFRNLALEFQPPRFSALLVELSVFYPRNMLSSLVSYIRSCSSGFLRRSTSTTNPLVANRTSVSVVHLRNIVPCFELTR